jgi:hypothetical protein
MAMRNETTQEGATLLDVLIDAFEKNEVMYGFHWRTLPMPDEASAVRKCAALVEEARRWKGAPSREESTPTRRMAAWDGLEIRQAGRGIMVLARAPWFSWWHSREAWEGDPIGPLYDWLEEERNAK